MTATASRRPASYLLIPDIVLVVFGIAVEVLVVFGIAVMFAIALAEPGNGMTW